MTLSPTSSRGSSGGSSSAGGPSCILYPGGDNALDLHAAGTYSPNFEVVYDNMVDWNVLPGLPDGIGVTNPLDGSSKNLLTTEAGVWYVECTLYGNDDPDIAGYLDIVPSDFALSPSAFAVGAKTFSTFSLKGVIAVPSGTNIYTAVLVTADASVNPYRKQFETIITRLA